MRSKIKILEFPVFCGYEVHVEFTSDIAQSLLKYPPTRKIEMDDQTSWLAVHNMDAPQSFIFLPYDAPAGSIAHEAWHVVRRMMEHAGVELDNETVAYHLGYLVNQIFKFARRK